MKFCSACGAKVEQKIPEGDNRVRAVCSSCETIHYENPKVVVGILPVWEDQVLLCKRAIEPRYGLWTLPAGFMENGESTLEGALRESQEEANASISNTSLYTLTDIPHINQVYVMYRGELDNTDFSPGIESLETQLYKEEDIPWDNLAFKIVEKTLQHFFEDRKQGVYPVRELVINPYQSR